MRERDLAALEFPRLCERLADFAVSPAGREACLATRPIPDRGEAEAALKRAWEVFRLLDRHGPAPLRAFPDVRAHLAAAAHVGFVLDGPSLVEVRTVLDAVHGAASYLRRQAESTPTLDDLRRSLVESAELRATLTRALDEEGVVQDQASDELAGVRRTIRQLRETLTRRLEELIRRKGMEDVVGDDYVTLRNARYVIPIRAGAAGRMAGVVQDRSISGETLFIEPLFAVDMNNQLLMAVKDEERIVRRILADLSDLVRGAGEEITQSFAALVELDRLLAGARFAARYRCSEPTLTDRDIGLRDARHPGLLFTGRSVVPVDLILPADRPTLVVTGPNTGGKTVALKTLGLCVLMAQSGLLVPAAEGARLAWFDAVYADVGDEQSVERDLSTFSGHVANLREILERGPRGALVLLDEPGVGTDPEEGAALAIGLIQHFESLGARLVLTTHYTPVKSFAIRHAGCQVAAVGFDVETMTPRYRLVYDSLGRSLAFDIAARLGLPEALLVAARAARSTESRDWDAALARLEARRHELEEELTTARALAERAAVREEEATRKLEEAERRRQRAWQEELREARAFLRSVREEGREALRAAREEGDRQAVEAFVRRREAAIAAQEAAVTGRCEEPLPSGPVRIGDLVEWSERGLRGQLLAIEGERAWIQRGAMRFEVPAAALRPAGRAAPEPVRVRLAVTVDDEARSEITLIGLRSREAVDRLSDFLDRAIRTGVPTVRIVHGIGSGALRRAVRDHLATSPYCAEFRGGEPGEGGDGVTVAVLGG